MHERELELLCRQYKKHFDQHKNDGKSKVVECFKRKEFDKIEGILEKSDDGKQLYFNQCVDLTLVQHSMFKNAGNPTALFNLFNKSFGLIMDLCEEEAELPDVCKRDLEIRSFEPVKLGTPRDQLKEEFIIEASYNREFQKLKVVKDRERRNRIDKKNIRIFGYKYPKVLKFMA